MEAAGIQLEAKIPDCLYMSDSAERGLRQLRRALEAKDEPQIRAAKAALSNSVVAWAVDTETRTNPEVAALAQVRASGIFTDDEVRGMDQSIREGIKAKGNVTGARSVLTTQLERVSGGRH